MLEDFRSEPALNRTSNRTFGVVVGMVFLCYGLAPLFKGHELKVVALAGGAGLLGAGLIFPKSLAWLNSLWFKLGQLLQKAVSPIVLAFMFYCILTPFGFLMRITLGDFLKLRFDEKLDSYWVHRESSKTDVKSLENPF